MDEGEVLDMVWHKLMKGRVQIAKVKRKIEVLKEMKDILQDEKILGTEQIAGWIAGQLPQEKSLSGEEVSYHRDQISIILVLE